MRMARIVRKDDGTRRASYDRGETPITSALPTAPAAVLLYDSPDRATARIRVLAFDLDAKQRIDGAPAGRRAAARDAVLIAETVERAGGACVVSAGPTGGHHVWIPLACPLPLAQAAALAHALRQVCPTIDPAPLGNAATGCMRPPGSPHAAGGFQALLTPLPEAVACLDNPNRSGVLDALWNLVAPEAGPVPTGQAAVVLPERQRPLPRRWEQLAAEGPVPGQYSNDASLARWYLILAVVRAGWTADEWVAAIGSWPWLSAQLANPRRLALARSEFEKAATQRRQGISVQIPDTSQESLHGGGAGDGEEESTTPRDQPQLETIHRRLRRVRTWLQSLVRSGRLSPGVHAIARAVLLFAHAGESQRIQVGVRALAIAAAVSRTTAGTALRTLESAGLVALVGRGIGRGADVWEVDLSLGEGLAPASGRIWATRPVFRVIGGHGAAEVYEALATASTPLSCRNLAGILGRSPTTINAHLTELAAWGLSTGGGRGGWIVGPSDPDELATRLGAVGLMAEQVARFRAERLAWWRWLEAKGLDKPSRRSPGLGQVVLLPASAPVQRHAASARGDRAGPESAALRAIDLVRSVLGATLVTAG